MVHSSIALLQERFRQLQRVKEMREKRELLKMLSTSNTDQPKLFNFNFSSNSSIIHHEPITRIFFHPELININSSSLSPNHLSLSLWPTTSQCMKEYDNNVCDSGVDTSLHL
ncbi:uncharacterized protein [Cicer arietinum]|uniref:uncharacterized protein n=1 Tax=Cicer arietinum TaxID=3827 RepID=UPI0006413819